MEKSVEKFLRSVRNGETVKKATKKNKRRMKTFHCVICNVTTFDAASFEIHLKGKKHRMKAPFSKSCEGTEYIHRYEHADDNVVIKCELCGVQLLDVVTHLNSSPHILQFLKANKPKVLQNLHLRGLHNISETDMKRIAVAEKCLEEFEQYVKSDDPVLMERIRFRKKIKRDEDCEPPRRKLKMDEPPCNKSATISDQMRADLIYQKYIHFSTASPSVEKKCGLDQNEKKHSASDERRIRKSDCRECQKFETGSPLKRHGCESPYKFTCNKDLYNFLQYFQISDETDVIFTQQIVKKFKSQVKEFYKDTEQEKATLSSNGNKNQKKGKLKIAGPAESILQQSDMSSSSEESPPHRCQRMLSFDSSDAEEVVRAPARRSTEREGGMAQPASGGGVIPEQDQQTSRDPVATQRGPLGASRVGRGARARGGRGRGSRVSTRDDEEELVPFIENDLLIQLVEARHALWDHTHRQHSDHVATRQLWMQVCTSLITTWVDLDARAQDQCYSDMLCKSTKKTIVTPSVPTSVLNSLHQSIVSIKKKPKTDAAVEEPPRDCTSFFKSATTTDIFSGNTKESITTGTIKAQPSMSKFGTGPPSAMYLDSFFTANKNKLVPAAQQRIAHLNCPPSPLNTYDARYMTFGGKKNMRISEVIAEVAKFADTKRVLKGIDINQVVQILIQNRTKKTTRGSHNSTP